MANANWPDTLPQRFTAGSYSRSHPDNRMRTAMEVGPAKLRRQQTLNVYTIAGDMVMSRAQLTDLRSFVDATTGGGVLAFNFPDQECGSAVEARFVSLPATARRTNSTFTVSLELEVLP